MTAPRTTLECHLAEVCLEDCTCPHEWKGLGILYGISMGDGWVRMTDAEECPVHGVDFHSALKDGDSRLSRRFPTWLRVGSCVA